jgi:DNA-directed RNA polymerase subunit omega
MARVTVEDCVDMMPNSSSWYFWQQSGLGRSSGSHITVDRENDKNGVIALREIAETVARRHVSEGLIHSMPHNAEVDEPVSTPEPVDGVSASAAP